MCKKILARWLKAMALIGSLLLGMTAVVNSYAGPHASQVSIVVYNCIPGKTLYPTIYSIGMSKTIPTVGAIQGPPAGSSLGTCGPRVELFGYTADAGHLFDAISGVVIVTGLNGNTLVYNENQAEYYSGSHGIDGIQYPNGNSANSTGTHYWIVHGASLGVLANTNNNGLPAGVSCPSGTSQLGSTCVNRSYSQPGTWPFVTPRNGFTVYVYPPAGGSSKDNYLPNLPS